MSDIYEVYNGKTCVKAAFLYEDSDIITYSNYHVLKKRHHLILARRGGNGREALVVFDTMRPDIKEAVVQRAGDPYKVIQMSELTKHLEEDYKAFDYYNKYRLPDGRSLTESRQQEYRANATVLNAITPTLRSLSGKYKSISKSTKSLWEDVAKMVQDLDISKWPHTLPTNARRLKAKVEDYRKKGYETLIPAYYGNQHRLKIKDEVKDFLLVQYCLPIKLTVPELLARYNYKREENDTWPELSESGVKAFIERPEIRRRWFLARHGKEAYMNEYGHTMKRDKDQWFPNAYWCVDGTKLDIIHFHDSANKMGAINRVNVIYDVYSEKIIGSSLSLTESHVDHFRALKEAVETTGHRPFLFTYDNQSGHKSAKMQGLYNRMIAPGGTHYPHKAYKKNNPIEQMFNRLQSQVISKLWFSDKQSITVKSDDNKPNMDFVKANKHHLPTLKECQAVWDFIVQTWNNMPHPKFPDQTRNQVFEHDQLHSCEVDITEALDLFWIEQNNGSTYTRTGIKMVVDKVTYEFEVYDDNDDVDIEFRRCHVGRKFIVKYDPTNLDTFVGLYAQNEFGDLTFVAYAQPKRAHEVIPILMNEGDKERAQKDMAISDREYQRDLKAVEDLMRRTGYTHERLIRDQDLMIKQGGSLHKEERNNLEKSVFERL